MLWNKTTGKAEKKLLKISNEKSQSIATNRQNDYQNMQF
jgi:hypothetical protein